MQQEIRLLLDNTIGQAFVGFPLRICIVEDQYLETTFNSAVDAPAERRKIITNEHVLCFRAEGERDTVREPGMADVAGNDLFQSIAGKVTVGGFLGDVQGAPSQVATK